MGLGAASACEQGVFRHGRCGCAARVSSNVRPHQSCSAWTVVGAWSAGWRMSGGTRVPGSLRQSEQGLLWANVDVTVWYVKQLIERG